MIEHGENVLTWRESLGVKYSDLPGVQKLHDFLVTQIHSGEVVMKVRKHCSSGTWKDSSLHTDISGTPTTTYKDKKLHCIKADELANMVTISGRFISPQTTYHHFNSHTSPSPQLQLHIQLSPLPHQLLCLQEGEERRVEDCDGTGHRIKARWNGRTTRSGCPLVHASC